MPAPSLRRAADKAARALRERDDLIRRANTEGMTIRAIAESVGLSPARVHQIIHHR